MADLHARPARPIGAADAPRSVIALVASVGGLEAVGQVLAGLPGTLDATILVLLHQQPDRTGDLVHLLSERSVLPVSAAEDAQRMGSGEVLVAPAGKHLLIAAGPTVRLILSGAAPPSRPSADLLLTSMALTLGPAAVAVVLSGNGHDGATGATAIHAFGGTVVATDEATSQVFSMPDATIRRDHAIDHVTPLGALPALLVALVGA